MVAETLRCILIDFFFFFASSSVMRLYTLQSDLYNPLKFTVLLTARAKGVLMRTALRRSLAFRTAGSSGKAYEIGRNKLKELADANVCVTYT